MAPARARDKTLEACVRQSAESETANRDECDKSLGTDYAGEAPQSRPRW